MEEISIKDLISKLRDELFNSVDDEKPSILFVDKVELELHVDLSLDGSGSVKIKAFNLLEAGLAGSEKKVAGHKIKLTLSPLISKEEHVELLKKDVNAFKRILEGGKNALHKGVALPGQFDK